MGKLGLLLMFLCLFGFIDCIAEGADESEGSRFYTIISGDTGGGLGKFSHDSSSNNIYDSNEEWDNTLYGFAGSIRFCLVSSSFMKKNKEKLSSLSPGQGGFGIEISGRRLTQRAGGTNVLLDEFQSTSITATLGLQTIPDLGASGPAIALFIGALGLGYTHNRFAEGFWNSWLVKASEEEGADVDIKTEIYPVVFTILPIKLEWLFHKNMAIGLDFSGLFCFRGRTDLAILALGDTSDNTTLPITFSESFWLTNCQIGLTLSFYLY